MAGIGCKYLELGKLLQVSEISYTISLLEVADNMIVSATNVKFECSFPVGYSD